MTDRVVSAPVRSYRVQAEVPRPARAGTGWRTIAVLNTYSGVGDLGEYLIDSMELSGIPREQARNWVMTRLRCLPQSVTTTSEPPEGMPVGP